MCFEDDVRRELSQAGPRYASGDYGFSLDQAIRTGRATRWERRFTIAAAGSADVFRVNCPPDGFVILSRATLRPTGTAALTNVVTANLYEALAPEVNAAAKAARTNVEQEPSIEDLVLANGSIAGDFSSTNHDAEPGYVLMRGRHLGIDVSGPTGTGVLLLANGWIVPPPRRA